MYFFSIRHMTRFRYTALISESVMEVRMQPRTENNQRCLEFQLQTEPRSQVMSYRDYHQNVVHHFGVPGRHGKLTIMAEALIETNPPTPLPPNLGPEAWSELDDQVALDGYWDMLMPSHFARPTSLLHDFMQEISLERRDDPLTVLLELNSIIYQKFEYVPMSTKVDSSIDVVLRTRRGVCQDFAHVMTALVRELGIPCRYVSGYLFHRHEDHDRSEEDATHAWLEAFLPNLGWVGFDPTNNRTASECHIRTAVGRDYADVPPTRGVFKGEAESELDVGVRVWPTEAPSPEEKEIELLPHVEWSPPDLEAQADDQQQQQQQQQQ